MLSFLTFASTNNGQTTICKGKYRIKWPQLVRLCTVRVMHSLFLYLASGYQDIGQNGLPRPVHPGRLQFCSVGGGYTGNLAVFNFRT